MPNALTTKLGPLPRWAWFTIPVGGYLAVRIIKSRSSASSTVADDTSTSGGTTIPDASSSTTATSTPSFSSLSDWQAAAVAAMANGTLSPADALNGITDWINGQCVSAEQYKGIGSIIETIGLPPGFSTVPVLSVCGTATTPAPSTSTTDANGNASGVATLSGSGFGVPGGIANISALVLGGDGHHYQYVQSPQQLAALSSSGATTYYQAAQGYFLPTKGATLATGTPVFAQVS